MTTLLVFLAAILVLALIIKFAKYLIAVYILLASICILGFPIAFFDLDLGIAIILWSALACAVLFFTACIAGILSGIFTVFVIAPLAGIWLSVKLALFKMDHSWKKK